MMFPPRPDCVIDRSHPAPRRWKLWRVGLLLLASAALVAFAVWS